MCGERPHAKNALGRDQNLVKLRVAALAVDRVKYIFNRDFLASPDHAPRVRARVLL